MASLCKQTDNFFFLPLMLHIQLESNMHFDFKRFPLKQQVLKHVPLCETFVSTGQEQRADETSGCPLKRKKVWADRKFPASALTMGLPVGHNTDGLHSFNTVNVSLLCFFIAINSDLFSTGNGQKLWCTRGDQRNLSLLVNIFYLFSGHSFHCIDMCGWKT